MVVHVHMCAHEFWSRAEPGSMYAWRGSVHEYREGVCTCIYGVWKPYGGVYVCAHMCV